MDWKGPKKCILLFSGGLDTSFCTVYLAEKGYDVVTLTVCTGGMSEEKKKAIEKASKKLGAIKHYTVNAEKEFFDKIVSYIIKANGLYQGVYPQMCADRYLLSKYASQIAKKESTDLIAHGCTATGNDQFRIEVPILCSNENLKIIAPVKELSLKREEEMDYLKEHGFLVPPKSDKYTINENVLGITISGSEIDEGKEIDAAAWEMTKLTKKQPEYVTIGFKQGLPCELNGKEMPGIEILKALNQIAGSHGYGQAVYVEDEILGIKGNQAFEAPGILLLIKAHKALEKLCLTKGQLTLKNTIDYKWSEMAYSGKLFDSVMKDMQAFIDSTQKSVNGKVKLKLHNKTAFLCEVNSPNGLIDKSVAVYAQKADWTGKDVNSFANFYTLQQKIANKKQGT